MAFEGGTPNVRYRPPDSHQLIPGVTININGSLCMWPVWCRPPFQEGPSLATTTDEIRAGHQRFLPDNYPLTNVSKIPRSAVSPKKGHVSQRQEKCFPKSFSHSWKYAIQLCTLQMCLCFNCYHWISTAQPDSVEAVQKSKKHKKR